MTGVLRVSGAQLDLDRCLHWLPPELIQRSWRRGEPSFLGKIEATSGFNLLLFESDGRLLPPDALRVVREIAPHLAVLARDGVASELDVALYVTHDQVASIEFCAADLRTLEQCGVTLRITAYPSGGSED